MSSSGGSHWSLLGEVVVQEGEVYARHVRRAERQRHDLTYRQKVKRTVLHLGYLRRGNDDIDTGRRSNLIVWNTNDAYRKVGGNNAVEYQREAGEPSRVCLSYKHDRDYYEVYVQRAPGGCEEAEEESLVSTT